MRCSRSAGDPPLRLKIGFARDDAFVELFEFKANPYHIFPKENSASCRGVELSRLIGLPGTSYDSGRTSPLQYIRDRRSAAAGCSAGGTSIDRSALGRRRDRRAGEAESRKLNANARSICSATFNSGCEETPQPASICSRHTSQAEKESFVQLCCSPGQRQFDGGLCFFRRHDRCPCRSEYLRGCCSDDLPSIQNHRAPRRNF